VRQRREHTEHATPVLCEVRLGERAGANVPFAGPTTGFLPPASYAATWANVGACRGRRQARGPDAESADLHSHPAPTLPLCHPGSRASGFRPRGGPCPPSAGSSSGRRGTRTLVLERHTRSYQKSLPRPVRPDGKLEAVIPEHEPTLTPDTIVPCGWPGCEMPVRLGRLVCDAHLDEMNIAAQLRTDRRCPDCGEPSPSACCCTSA
jgi:hypothetical protein